MIVLVLAVLAYWVVQNVLHDQPDGAPVAADYLSTVEDVQGAGIDVVYPRTLPKGWIASHEPEFTPGDRPVWSVPILTDDGRFVGIQQEDARLSDMLHVALPRGARQGEDVRIDSQVGESWSSWSSGNGDHAFATEAGDDTLLVYGSAPVEDLKRLIGVLTTDKVS